MFDCLLMILPFKMPGQILSFQRNKRRSAEFLSLYGSQWLISFNALEIEYTCIIISKRKTR